MSSAVESRRARKSHRLRQALVIAAVLVVGWVGFGLWWSWSLAGLPDVGDPFDVAAFDRSRQVAPDEDALPLYQRACRLLTRPIKSPLLGRAELPLRRWEEADAKERARAMAELPALIAWASATERPDCSAIATGLAADTFFFRDFIRQAALEATRLEANGDPVEAWSWYRSILRSLNHAERASGIGNRYDQLRLRAVVAPPIMRWAADERVGAEALRTALADLVKLHEESRAEIDSYKEKYLTLMKWMEGAGPNPDYFHGPLVPVLGALPPTTNRVWMPMRQEPERSRRVVKLIFANWLAWASQPRAARPRPLSGQEGDVVLYPVAADAPASARTISAERLIRWHRSSSYARFLYLGQDGENLCEYVIVRERAARARLIVAVAEQLYRREHGGEAPPPPEALVGPYLKRLPDGLDGPLPQAE